MSGHLKAVDGDSPQDNLLERFGKSPTERVRRRAHSPIPTNSSIMLTASEKMVSKRPTRRCQALFRTIRKSIKTPRLLALDLFRSFPRRGRIDRQFVGRGLRR